MARTSSPAYSLAESLWWMVNDREWRVDRGQLHGEEALGERATLCDSPQRIGKDGLLESGMKASAPQRSIDRYRMYSNIWFSARD